MVVLSDDILTIPPEQIIDISVEMTIVEGETVYKKQ
jgi:predicted amidohydrolase YtcJ